MEKLQLTKRHKTNSLGLLCCHRIDLSVLSFSYMEEKKEEKREREIKEKKIRPKYTHFNIQL